MTASVALRGRWRELAPRLLNFKSVLSSVALCGCALLARPAQASCLQPQEQGHWVNVSPGIRSVARIELRFVCQDRVLNGLPYPPGPAWYVRVFGKCPHADCDWHEVGAQRLATAHIFAVYDQGGVQRYVYTRMSQMHPGELWVWVWTAFKDPTHPAYGVHDWFRRVEDDAERGVGREPPVDAKRLQPIPDEPRDAAH